MASSFNSTDPETGTWKLIFQIAAGVIIGMLSVELIHLVGGYLMLHAVISSAPKFNAESFRTHITGPATVHQEDKPMHFLKPGENGINCKLAGIQEEKTILRCDNGYYIQEVKPLTHP